MVVKMPKAQKGATGGELCSGAIPIPYKTIKPPSEAHMDAVPPNKLTASPSKEGLAKHHLAISELVGEAFDTDNEAMLDYAFSDPQYAPPKVSVEAEVEYDIHECAFKIAVSFPEGLSTHKIAMAKIANNKSGKTDLEFVSLATAEVITEQLYPLIIEAVATKAAKLPFFNS